MKFTCNKNSILKEITIAQEIISSRNSLSILSNVLLEADNNTLTIKATDLKVGFQTQTPIEVIQPGSTTVYCDKFLGILRSLPEGDIEFENVDDRLYIRPLFKKINFQLRSIPSEKFPELPNTGTENYFQLAQKDLIEMINQTIFAVSDDETRYFMNGVYLERSEGELTMVATDGRRLSLINRNLDVTGLTFDPVIIPPKALGLIKKLASGEGDINIAVADKGFFVEFDNQKVFSNLIEGQFPNYKRVIPDSQSYELTVSRTDLVEAVKRVSLLVEQKSRRIYLNITNNTLQISSEESEIGVAKEDLACDYSGPDMVLAMNYMYLLDPLRVMDQEEISLRFTEPNKAITLYPLPEKDYFHIIMPMQID